MTGQEIIQQVRDAFDDYETVELFARGDTYASREQLKRLDFEWLAHDEEWRTTVYDIRGGGLWAKPVHISESGLDELIAAGVEFSVEE